MNLPISKLLKCNLKMTQALHYSILFSFNSRHEVQIWRFTFYLIKSLVCFSHQPNLFVESRKFLISLNISAMCYHALCLFNYSCIRFLLKKFKFYWKWSFQDNKLFNKVTNNRAVSPLALATDWMYCERNLRRLASHF